MLQADQEQIGNGKRRYYLARAELARLNGDSGKADHYTLLAGALPLGDNNEN